MLTLVPLHTVPDDEVEALLDAAFGADRHQRTAYKLRDGAAANPSLSLAAFDGEQLVGTIQCWPVALETPGGTPCPMTLVGPVAVLPDLQRGGVGKAMMAEMLKAAEVNGHDAMIMIGDPEYYERFFGFSADATQGWSLPGPFERHRLLARITRPGGIPTVGRVIPDPAFAQLGHAA